MIFKPSIKKLVIEKGSAEDYYALFNGDERLKPMLGAHMESGNGEIWLAKCGKRIIGRMYTFKNLDDKDAADGQNVFYISSLLVNRWYRGQGVGTGLINCVNENYKKSGYSASTLGVYEDKEDNIRLYKRLGYTEFVKKCNTDLVLVNKRGEHKPTKEYIVLKKYL